MQQLGRAGGGAAARAASDACVAALDLACLDLDQAVRVCRAGRLHGALVSSPRSHSHPAVRPAPPLLLTLRCPNRSCERRPN